MLEFGSERVTSQALADSQPEMGRMSIWLGGIKYGVGETPVLTSISSRIWYSDGQSSGGDLTPSLFKAGCQILDRRYLGRCFAETMGLED
jgi:hypothetical protein